MGEWKKKTKLVTEIQSVTYRATRSASSRLLSSLAVSFRPPFVPLVGTLPELFPSPSSPRLVTRFRLASSSSSVCPDRGHKPLSSLQHPRVPSYSPFHLRRLLPNFFRDSEDIRFVGRGAVRGTERLQVVLEAYRPALLRTFPARALPSRRISRFGSHPSGCLVAAPARSSRR